MGGVGGAVVVAQWGAGGLAGVAASFALVDCWYTPTIYNWPMAKLDPSEWEGCDWDDGNIGKNWPKHRVTDWEIEEVFLNVPIAFGSDAGHSSEEDRYFALGQTNRARRLFVAFTVRGRLVRPISARDMNARERRSYEALKEDTQIQG